ncbi:MAG: hypothetical protein ACI8RZ_002349 [Myxococcota bacterium]|jgi:hypothetical protein
MDDPTADAAQKAKTVEDGPVEDAPAEDLLNADLLTEGGSGTEQEPPEVAEEVALGSTPAGVATNNGLRALSRAARSFLLYDPTNDAIRVFLADYRDAMKEALVHGPMDLEVRPFEMVRESEVVYMERDRERSLAFRMFRDGVRRLTITPEVAWDELLRLLEILSVRYTGVRQQEDDIVTLLWKAGFSHIEIAAVEGFVPDDDEDDEEASAVRAARAGRRAESHMEAPTDWDLPLPEFGAPVELAYEPIPEAALEALSAEVSSQSIPVNSLRLVSNMLEVVADPLDPTTIEDVRHLIEEVRDFLLSEGQLNYLVDMARTVSHQLRNNPSEQERLLSTFTNERALRRIVRSVGKGHSEIPPELLEMLNLVPTDHLSNLVSLLKDERATTTRTILRKLISHYIVTRASFVIKSMGEVEFGVARDLLAALAEAVPDRAVEAVEAVAATADTELQYEMLRVLAAGRYGPRVRAVLMGLTRAPIEDVRLKALGQLIGQKDPDLFRDLVKHVEARATSTLLPSEADMIGRALVELNPKGAQRLLSDWIRPKGLLKRFGAVPGQKMLRWTAASGVGRLPGDKNEKLIRWLAEQAGADLHRHCMRVLFVRRKEGTINV